MLLTKRLPKWISHILTNKFLNQDALFLHIQERNLHNSGEYTTVKGEGEESDNYVDSVIPMSSDKGVLLYRKWFKTKAGGRVPFKGSTAMSPIDKETVYDVYESHTKHCTACMGALKNLRKVRFASAAIAAASGIWGPVVLGNLGTGMIVFALAGIALAANKVIGLMLRMEYSHSEND